MADETTTSVSKGCFVFKPSRSTSARRKRHSSTEDDVLKPVNGESQEHLQLRLENYNECWSCMKTKIQKLQSNAEIFSQLLCFIKDAHKRKETSAAFSHHGIIKEIPTAAFITGVNMPDHEVIFSELSRELKGQVSPFVALLHSKDCTAIKMIVKNAMLQLMGTEYHQDEDDDELNSSQMGKKITNFTMPTLCHWYKQVKKDYQLQKQRGKSTQYPDNLPLVIVLEDFEGFGASVVQDFILILSQYISELPIVLVFGIATAITAVHRVLPHAVSTRLAMEKFQTQPSHAVLLEIMTEVLMTAKFPFKLSGSVFRFLYENFLYHDFSLQNFARGLQFCMMEHFSSNPISLLCCLDMNQRVRVTSELTHEQLELLRQTMSFRRFVEGQEPRVQCRLLRQDDYTKGAVFKMLQELEEYHWCFFPVLQCLHIMTANLPKHPLGRKARDVYEFSLNSNIYELEDYKEAISLLKVYARDELVPLLQKCVDMLGAALECKQGARYCQKLKEPKHKVASFLEQFEKLTENALVSRPFDFTDLSPPEQLENESSGTSSQKIEVLPQAANRFELQERLRIAAKQKRKESPFDQLRQETVQYLDDLFRRFLQCPRHLPLMEVMYYDSVTEVKQRMVGMPRVAIQTALSNPQYYLKCKCCPDDVGTIQDTMPDISVAYKLHLECGRLINLFDWLQAFTVVLEPDTRESGKRSPKKKKTGEELQARFIRAVSELQFLGFIKSTRRKTDHVQRLTWGGC